MEAGRGRRYHDACGAPHALDLVGERWALLVMRELMLGPKRFGDLKSDLGGISANVLTQRLEGLESAGIVLRRRLPPPASVQVYELTAWGYESEQIFQALGRWAARSPSHDPRLPLSAVSLVMSLRTMFVAERARGVDFRVGLRFGDEAFLLRVRTDQVQAARGDIDAADVIFRGRPEALAGAVYGGAQLEALAADGVLTVEGDRALAERFLTLFELPPKVET